MISINIEDLNTQKCTSLEINDVTFINSKTIPKGTELLTHRCTKCGSFLKSSQHLCTNCSKEVFVKLTEVIQTFNDNEQIHIEYDIFNMKVRNDYQTGTVHCKEHPYYKNYILKYLHKAEETQGVDIVEVTQVNKNDINWVDPLGNRKKLFIVETASRLCDFRYRRVQKYELPKNK